jgi:hypothetical protein
MLADSGSYTLTATTTAGSVTSLPIVLMVILPPPTITTQPASQSVNAGVAVTFSVQATGTLLSYQWHKNGTDISGATAANYTISSASSDDAGDYSVAVTNPGGSVMSDIATLTFRSPQITTLNPSPIFAAGANFTLTVNGQNFANAAQILWNGTLRTTHFFSASQLTADIFASDIATANDVTAVLITVQNPSGDTSNAVSLPIVTPNVVAVQSSATATNTSSTVTTAPSTSGDAGVTTTLQNNSTTATAAISVANYAANPTSTPFVDVGGKYVDVQVTNADPTDTATSSFYYPSTIAGQTETDLILQYFDGTAWQPVLSSGGATPAKDTADNLDGTVSGGRFTVVFDNTSTPKITELTGTFFGVTVKDTTPPIVKSITASSNLLTPPDHKLVPVTLTVKATDNFDPRPTSRIVSVTSSEPVNGKSDGNTSPDWQITGALTVNLRAERADDGPGRAYTLTVETKDAAGNKTITTTTVIVPKGADAAKHAPNIFTQPADATITTGADAAFNVSVELGLPVTYQWRFNGAAIAESSGTAGSKAC